MNAAADHLIVCGGPQAGNHWFNCSYLEVFTFVQTGNFFFWFFFVFKYVEQQGKEKLARTVPVVLQRNWQLKGRM
jgi:hypothetical protein